MGKKLGKNGEKNLGKNGEKNLGKNGETNLGKNGEKNSGKNGEKIRAKLLSPKTSPRLVLKSPWFWPLLLIGQLVIILFCDWTN